MSSRMTESFITDFNAGMDWKALSKKHHLPRTTTFRYMSSLRGGQSARPATKAAPGPLRDSEATVMDFGKDSGNVTIPKVPGRRIKDLEGLLRECNVDLDVWEIERHIVNKWEVGAKNKDHELVVEPLFQVKIWLRRQGAAKLLKDLAAELIADMSEHAPVYAPIVRPPATEEGHLLELCIPDVHLGKLCWDLETGGGNYDTDIAEQVYKESIEHLVNRAIFWKIDRIVLPVGSDLLNVDGSHNATTGGTAQSVDGRYQRTFRRATQILVQIIDRLSLIADVDVVSVPGNHDRESTFTIMEVLSAWYRQNSNVRVFNGPNLRKYYRYGTNLILYTHGSEEKPLARLSEIAAAECQEWSECEYREAHIGHLHKSLLDERHGFRIRILPSLCPPEEWHARMGFVGNVRSACAMLWTKTQGRAAQIDYNLSARPNKCLTIT
jgi:hypothetical protein